MLKGVSLVKLIEPPCTERYARWCERSVGEIIAYLLLDSFTEGRNPMDVGRILITLLACAVTVYRIVSDDE